MKEYFKIGLLIILIISSISGIACILFRENIFFEVFKVLSLLLGLIIVISISLRKIFEILDDL